MRGFLIRRATQAMLTVAVISVVAFLLTHITGSPADAMLPPDADAAARDRLEQELGLDRPLYEQYVVFLRRAAVGDFGVSLRLHRPAMPLVLQRFVATLRLAGTALLFSVVLAVPIGMLSAVKKNSPVDKAGKVIALLGQSLAPFWLAIILIWVFAVNLRWLPASGDGQGSLRHLVLPSIALGWYQVAAIMRLTRSAMLDVLDSEYTKLARLKGLREWVIIWKHCLRNAIIVPLTYFGLIVGAVITRTVVVETVFGWPGTGSLVIQSVSYRDFPVINAALVVFALVFIVTSFIVDVLYAIIDPRIQLR